MDGHDSSGAMQAVEKPWKDVVITFTGSVDKVSRQVAGDFN